ncbi:MAG: heme biosynthesis protein HemY [Gammaproteobacteria bacterium]|nr:MAG: heme biosynthesis protein HemY [Gammaproteobacteria bacterium]
MIRFILMALLFIVVIAVTPMLIGEKGYILIAMANWTIESTVVTGIIMLVLSFLALLVLIKVFRGGFKFGSLAWHKVVFAGRRKAQREFHQGIAAYLLKDYPQAEQLMAKCAESSGQEKLAWLVAASAASKQIDNKNAASNSAHYLKLIAEAKANDKTNNKIMSLESVLITADLFIHQQAYHQARKVIDDNHKLIGHDARLLSVEIDLCIIEKRYQTAADYLVSARKQKTLGANKINAWENVIFTALFNEQIKAFDQQHLHNYWQKLAKKVKQRETVLLAYCQVLAANNLFEPLNKLLLPALKKEASAEFLKQLRGLAIKNAEALITTVQKHLQKQPQSNKWLSALAHLASGSEQWSMADKAFNALLKLGESCYDKQDLLAYAQLQQRQGNYQQANELLMKINNTNAK